jgi:SAM-dependent methyltransferase
LEDIERIKNVYRGRREIREGLYSPLSPAVFMGEQEKYRTLVKWIRKAKINPGKTRMLEIGCGYGNNLIHFLQLGFDPVNLYANELMDFRLEKAKSMLPAEIKFFEGDAAELDFNGEFDVVFQSMVFSSITNRDFQKELAGRMWNWIKPGGGVLWYDFIYNNPSNPDVTGVTVNDAKKLFPYSECFSWKITLAPPVSRLVTKLHPGMYTFFNSLRFLRTHYLIYFKKNNF